MSDLIEIQNDIRKYYIIKQKLRMKEKYIGVQLTLLKGGLSNANYLAVVKDMSTNKEIAHVLYRKFGTLSSGTDHALETAILEYLAKKGVGPKLLYEDPNGKFRLVEYLDGTITVPRSKSFEKDFLNKLYPIVNIYSLFSYTYKYKIRNGKIEISPIEDGIKEKRFLISKNQYETCLDEWYDKVVVSFQKFSEQFKQRVSKEKEPKEWEKLEFAQYHLDNFKKEFVKIFPTEGFFVLCHNDTHRLNFLLRKKDQKLFILDHEYAYLNLAGNDIVNYCNESFFNYDPEYYCTLDKINFDKLYQYYLQFIEQFIQSHKFIANEEGGAQFLKMMKTKKYYLKLNNIANLYYFLWSFCYLDFPTWEKNHYEEFYFVHGVDRLKVYLAGMKELEKL